MFCVFCGIVVPYGKPPPVAIISHSAWSRLFWQRPECGWTTGAHERIRREVSAADSSLVASNPRPLVEMLSDLTAQQKTYATLMTFFAVSDRFLLVWSEHHPGGCLHGCNLFALTDRNDRNTRTSNACDAG